jgi:hypothetical protein
VLFVELKKNGKMSWEKRLYCQKSSTTKLKEEIDMTKTKKEFEKGFEAGKKDEINRQIASNCSILLFAGAFFVLVLSVMAIDPLGIGVEMKVFVAVFSLCYGTLCVPYLRIIKKWEN